MSVNRLARLGSASKARSSPSASRITRSGRRPRRSHRIAPAAGAAPGRHYGRPGDARPGDHPRARLRVEDRPDPEPGPGEVLVRVHGAGLNRADLVQLAGFYAAPPGSPPDIPGLEFAGEVVAHGPGVDRARARRPRVRHRRRRRPGRAARRCPRRSARRSPNGSTSWRPPACPRCSSPRTTRWSTRPASRPARPCSCTRSARASAPPRCNSAGRSAARWWARPAPPRSWNAVRELGLDHAVLAPRELDPAALAADITAAAGAGRRRPGARRWRLPRDRPRGRRAARPHRAHRHSWPAPRARARYRRRSCSSGSACSAPCSAGVRCEREGGRPPRRSCATSCRCSRRARSRPVIARTLSLDDARRGLRPAGRRRGVRQASCSTSPEPGRVEPSAVSPISTDTRTMPGSRPVLRPVDPERSHRVEADDPHHRVLARRAACARSAGGDGRRTRATRLPVYVAGCPATTGRCSSAGAIVTTRNASPGSEIGAGGSPSTNGSFAGSW